MKRLDIIESFRIALKKASGGARLFPLAMLVIAAALFSSNTQALSPLAGGTNVVASSPSFSPVFRAVTGPGTLISISTNTTDCATDSNVWITNVVSSLLSNESVSVQFTIAGGSDGILYDVFGTPVFPSASDTSHSWVWLGQAYHCSTYQITNLPAEGAFLVLGKDVDSDL